MSAWLTSVLVTSIDKEAQEMIASNWVSYIHYPILLWKDKNPIWALINSSSKIKAMTPAYTSKLDLKM